MVNAINDMAKKLRGFVNYEAIKNDKDKMIVSGALYSMFMELLSIPKDENSEETAYRVVKMMFNERCLALRKDPPKFTTFPANGYDEYVVVKDIPYFSLCSHHHVTFYGKVYVAYHPNKEVLGLSKFARIVYYFAAKPQIQEGMTNEIADYLFEHLKPIGLAVKVIGNHLCMESRGAKAVGSVTVTQSLRGSIDKLEVAELFK